MGDLAEPKMAELTIRSRETIEPGGQDRVSLSVFCQERGCSTPLHECNSCVKCHGYQLDPDARGGRLSCHVLHQVESTLPRLAPSDEGDSPSGSARLDTSEHRNAMQTRVSEVMDSRVLCVEATLPVDELIPLLVSRNVHRVPVVDPSGAPLGIVSKTDLLLRKHLDLTYRHRSSIRQVEGTRQVPSTNPSGGAVPVRTVRDVMTSGAFALSEAAPLARASALMAYEGIESIVVISQHGHVVGLLSALNIAEWVAKTHGFALASSA